MEHIKEDILPNFLQIQDRQTHSDGLKKGIGTQFASPPNEWRDKIIRIRSYENFKDLPYASVIPFSAEHHY